MAYKIKGAVTYMPKSQTIWQGHHEDFPVRGSLLGRTELKTSTPVEGEGPVNTIQSFGVDPRLKQLAGAISANRQKIMEGALVGADFEAERANLDNLILIKLYNQIMGDQMKWFYLDDMFNTIQLDQLLYRMSFKDNPAAAQTVPRREEYDTAKVKYDDINFNLPKVVVAYDMPIEDPLRALLDPILPLQQTNEYSMAYHREQEALKALQALGNHYTKNATGAARFNATSAPSAANALVSNPATVGATATHSTHRTVDELQNMRTQFMQQNDVMLTHCAVSPATIQNIASNTWTAPNTIFNTEAYRTTGGTRPFPGLSNCTAVISQIVPDNTLFFACKPLNVLVKAEGPKITRAWENNNNFTNVQATLDFHQYKCAHEDFKTIKRRYGVIVDLSTA